MKKQKSKYVKSDQFWKADPGVDIYEIDNITFGWENGLRAWKSIAGVKLQIRAFCPTTKSREGKRRPMIANVHMTIHELEELLKYAKSK